MHRYNMDHRYQTRRNELRDISSSLSHLSILVSVNAASTENMARIIAREDTLISDGSLRDAILPHSKHLGLLVHMIEEVAVHHDACKSGDLVNTLDATWRKRLGGFDTFSDAQIAILESIASSLRHSRDKLSSLEGLDAGSSSPSDYSDSDSRSSDGSYDYEEGGEEEEGGREEEEEDASPPPRRRRR